jgi:hypothetical protein
MRWAVCAIFLFFVSCSERTTTSEERRYDSIEKCQTPQIQTCVSPALTDGHYIVKSVKNPDLVLDLRTQDGRSLQLMMGNSTVHQLFYFGRRDEVGCYAIHAIGSGQGDKAKYLRPAFNNDGVEARAPVLQHPCGPFRWQVVPVADALNVFKIQQKMTGKCMDVRDQDVRPGGRVQLVGCNDSPNQRWIFYGTDPK